MTEPSVYNLPTPSLLLDVNRMTRNIQDFEARLGRLGVPLRPHVKTCKNFELTRNMMPDNAPGITVSTLAEADYFFSHGIEDQIYAVGIAPGKLDDVAERMDQGMRLKIILDNTISAGFVAEAARRLGCRFEVLLEIDSDGQRGGFGPNDAALIDAARELDAAGCRVLGVLTHMGASYNCRSRKCLVEAAEHERSTALAAAQALRQAGFDSPMVSIGSTPTARFAKTLDGITEVRAGTYVFMDLVMAGLGVCKPEDIAISVLSEVIGHRLDAGEWLIDAGWMALSRDRGTASQAIDYGYGRVCDDAGRLIDDLVVRSTNQEHGIVADRHGRPLAADRFRIGQRLRILPNHCCATAASHAGYWLVGEDREPSRWLDRCSGW
ncbi:MAG: alanine racemase [Wenzhouxiangellaceae bacterium]|nr:alanine racemase [Wenzhouxiangellaceae bacterium]